MPIARNGLSSIFRLLRSKYFFEELTRTDWRSCFQCKYQSECNPQPRGTDSVDVDKENEKKIYIYTEKSLGISDNRLQLTQKITQTILCLSNETQTLLANYAHSLNQALNLRKSLRPAVAFSLNKRTRRINPFKFSATLCIKLKSTPCKKWSINPKIRFATGVQHLLEWQAI